MTKTGTTLDVLAMAQNIWGLQSKSGWVPGYGPSVGSVHNIRWDLALHLAAIWLS